MAEDTAYTLSITMQDALEPLDVAFVTMAVVVFCKVSFLRLAILAWTQASFLRALARSAAFLFARHAPGCPPELLQAGTQA